MPADAVDPIYLAYQYADSSKLRIRAETHQRYTVYPAGVSPGQGDPFIDSLLGHLRLQRAGLTLLDVGCGPGTLHGRLQREYAVWVVGVDTSLGLLAEAGPRADRGDHCRRGRLAPVQERGLVHRRHVASV